MKLRSQLIFSLAALAFALSVTSCRSAPKKVPPATAPVDAKKELSQIHIDIAAGADKKALTRLKSLVTRHPRSDVADDATMQMARIYFKQGQFDSAYKSYMSLIETDVFSPHEAEALLGASRCLHKMGRLDESLALVTRGLAIAGLSDQHKLELHRQRYALLSAMGDRLDALQSLAYIYEKEPRADVKANAQARALELVNLCGDSDLEKIVSKSDYGFVRARAAFRLGVAHLKQKQFDEARERFARAAEWGRGTPVETHAINYISQLDSRRTVDPRMIGAVLPLSGKYAPIAQKTLRGLQFGLGFYGPNGGDFKLAVVDSEGTPEGARKAVERLVAEDNVVAIVGSLLSRTAAAVASKADELGVPSVALSQKSGLTESSTYVFRNAVTSEMQVRELVRFAMEKLGLKKFAILFPNEPYGVEYANLFWDEVASRGGTVVGAQPYGRGETDFRAPIKRLVGTFYLEDRRLEYQNRVRDWFKKQKKLKTRLSPPDDLLPPVVDFEAIFIPDGPKAIGQIAPMLAYQGVSNVRLLGTNVWNNPDLVRRGQKNVENAVFVDSDFLNDPKFRTSKFYRDYTHIFGEEPGLFETQGYETGLMLRQVLQGGERSRAGVAEGLSQMTRFEGVMGPMAMNNLRELARPLTPFLVKQGEILPWSQGQEVSEPPGPAKKTTRK